MKQVIATITFRDDHLYIIDQRLLPVEEKVIELTTRDEVWQAIRTLAVRGAPAIGVAAAYGVYISLKDSTATDLTTLKREAGEVIEYLSTSRPTAYNLFYALDRMKKVVESVEDKSSFLKLLREEAIRIHEEDIEKSDKIGEWGLTVVPENARILTHCNAGGLATGGNGTALAVVFAAHASGKNISVWVDETRPLLQGARLTAWEMKKAGIPYRVITDNMAGMLMKREEVDMIVVGADRIAANGDFANKIGTYSVAVLAQHHGIPFYTAAPLTTFDLSLRSGDEIPIEEREPDEIIYFRDQQSAPENSPVFNPAFDVTPAQYLTGIITEYGVISPPFRENIKKVIGSQYAEIGSR